MVMTKDQILITMRNSVIWPQERNLGDSKAQPEDFERVSHFPQALLILITDRKCVMHNEQTNEGRFFKGL